LVLAGASRENLSSFMEDSHGHFGWQSFFTECVLSEWEKICSGRHLFLGRPDHKGTDDGDKPEDNPENPEDEWDSNGCRIRVCQDQDTEDDRQETKETDAPSPASEASDKGDKPIDQGNDPDHDHEDKRQNESAVKGVGQDQETKDNSKETEYNFHTHMFLIGTEAHQGEDTGNKPVGTEEDDKHQERLERVGEQEDTKDQCDNALQEQEPPGEEGSHEGRCGRSVCHFSCHLKHQKKLEPSPIINIAFDFLFILALTHKMTPKTINIRAARFFSSTGSGES
jgi:hypothetical protein